MKIQYTPSYYHSSGNELLLWQENINNHKAARMAENDRVCLVEDDHRHHHLDDNDDDDDLLFSFDDGSSDDGDDFTSFTMTSNQRQDSASTIDDISSALASFLNVHEDTRRVSFCETVQVRVCPLVPIVLDGDDSLGMACGWTCNDDNEETELHQPWHTGNIPEPLTAGARLERLQQVTGLSAMELRRQAHHG